MFQNPLTRLRRQSTSALSHEQQESVRQQAAQHQADQEHLASGGSIERCGEQIRYLNARGQVHRAGDLPAIIADDGTQYWYVDGVPHRDNDQPSVIYPSGHRLWHVGGKVVRERGVAGVPDDFMQMWDA